MKKNKWFLNGGRGSGRTFRLLCETYENKIAELEKENAKLQKEIRCECTRCVYSDSPCIRSDYGVENDEDVCPNYENVFAVYTQLKEENAELKHTVAELRRDKDNLNTHTKAQEKLSEYRSNQLTKAKEIIKKLLSVYISYADSFDDRDNEIVAEAEQFLKE